MVGILLSLCHRVTLYPATQRPQFAVAGPLSAVLRGYPKQKMPPFVLSEDAHLDGIRQKCQTRLCRARRRSANPNGLGWAVATFSLLTFMGTL